MEVCVDSFFSSYIHGYQSVSFGRWLCDDVGINGLAGLLINHKSTPSMPIWDHLELVCFWFIYLY